MPDPTYYDQINETILSLIPRQARLVLEVGCGTGALGEAFKREAPDCRYVGIECMEQPAACARTRLDEVRVGDVEQMGLDALGLMAGTVDCLIYGDVLEHLVDPWRVLTRHRELLAPDGVILASIPNVQHWRAIGNLLSGEWPYSDTGGLFDRTHLRFFTYNSTMSLFRDSGLEVRTVMARHVAQDQAERFAAAMLPSLQALNIDPKVFLDRTRVYQWIVVAGLGGTKKNSI